MNYVQDLFLVVVFVHIASGPAALLLLLLLGFSWKKTQGGSCWHPSRRNSGVCWPRFMEQMWVSLPLAGSRGHPLLPRGPLTGWEMPYCLTGGQCSLGSKLIHSEHHCWREVEEKEMGEKKQFWDLSFIFQCAHSRIFNLANNNLSLFPPP